MADRDEDKCTIFLINFDSRFLKAGATEAFCRICKPRLRNAQDFASIHTGLGEFRFSKCYDTIVETVHCAGKSSLFFLARYDYRTIYIHSRYEVTVKGTQLLCRRFSFYFLNRHPTLENDKLISRVLNVRSGANSNSMGVIFDRKKYWRNNSQSRCKLILLLQRNISSSYIYYNLINNGIFYVQKYLNCLFVEFYVDVFIVRLSVHVSFFFI